MNNKFGVITDDLTVLLYLECYSNIEIDEIRICTELFNLLDKNTIEAGNYPEEGFVKYGVKILPADKKFRANKAIDFSTPVQMYTDMKDLLFFKSLHSLSGVLPYLNADDRACLNNLFNGMKPGLNKGIGEFKEINGQKIIPIFNYKKQEIMKKPPVKK